MPANGKICTPMETVGRVQAEQFFSGKNPAVFATQNPRIFPLASAKNSQKYPPHSSHSVHIFQYLLHIQIGSLLLFVLFPG